MSDCKRASLSQIINLFIPAKYVELGDKAMTAFVAKDLKDYENFKIARIDRIIQKPIRFPDLREMINDAWKR